MFPRSLSTRDRTISGFLPEFVTICLNGAEQACSITSTPCLKESLRLFKEFLRTRAAARTSAVPPPGRIPSSPAAFVA